MPRTSLFQPDILTFTPNILLFNIILQKAKSNLAHEKWENTAKLNSIGASSYCVRLKTLSASVFDKDDYIDEIHNKVKLLVSQFVDLPTREIAKIYVNNFCSINLYKLHHMRRGDNIYRDLISIKVGTLKMWKVTLSYKDYSRDNILWSKIFLKCILIFIKLFDSTTPFLHLILDCFY